MTDRSILFVAQNLSSRSGAGVTAGHAICAAADAECDVHVLTASRDADGHGAQTIVLGPRPRLTDGPVQWGLAAKHHLRTRRLAIERLNQLQPDRVMVNSLGSLALWQTIKSRVSCHRTLMLQESPRHFTAARRSRSLNAMRWFDQLVFASSRCLDEWSALLGQPDVPMHYLPNTCDDELIQAVRRQSRSDVRQECGIADDCFAMVCVASIQHRKGHDLLIDHLPEVLQQVSNAHLYLVGHCDDPLARTLRKRVESSTLREHVTFVGHSDQALAWIYASDVLVLPSRAEAMPLTVLEAMALGTPVVASAVDGIPELIENGRTGRLFPIDQPRQLAEALSAAAMDTTNSQIMANDAQKYYTDNFCTARYRQRFAAMLSDG